MKICLKKKNHIKKIKKSAPNNEGFKIMINDLNIKLCNNNNGQVSLTSVGIYLDRTKPSCLRDVKVLLQITLGRKPNFR